MRCKYESFGCYECIHSSPPSGSSAIRGGKIVYCENVDSLVSEVIFFYRLLVFFLTCIQWLTPNSLKLLSALCVPGASFTFSPSSTAQFLHLFHSLSFPSPLTLKCFFFLTHISTHLFGRAVPGAMWQPRRLLRRPVPVRGGLDWRCVRPESMPSSLRRARPVPRWDLRVPTWLGGRAL